MIKRKNKLYTVTCEQLNSPVDCCTASSGLYTSPKRQEVAYLLVDVYYLVHIY